MITDDRLIMQKVEISKVSVCEVRFCDSGKEKGKSRRLWIYGKDKHVYFEGEEELNESEGDKRTKGTMDSGGKVGCGCVLMKISINLMTFLNHALI